MVQRQLRSSPRATAWTPIQPILLVDTICARVVWVAELLKQLVIVRPSFSPSSISASPVSHQISQSSAARARCSLRFKHMHPS